MNNLLSILFIGVGATALMDLWGLARKPLLGIPTPNYGMVGRWIAHMTHGQFRHKAIATSPPIQGEHPLGWTAHYLIGIAFAALLHGIGGDAWIQSPTIGLAVLVGMGTVVAPFFIMQPGMGAGIAGSKTSHPTTTRMHSFITHSIFGLGLYLSATLLQLVIAI